ncbi:MAG TPA: MoxR family ATPase [Candidatus Dormibacteraeota bacterium]|nr:MoxR family ATPase [Candidatus Dormibacteraeota bacterium]
MNAKAVAQRFLEQAHRIIVGQDEPLRLALLCLLTESHLLLEGVPGTAKTLLARTVARLIRGSFARIQFTPDLMPSDLLGTSVYEIATSRFSLRLGPIFANVVLADEVNRAPAKTQSALLEAMEERQVTLEGSGRPLPRPFLVLATQNPVEYEGTYPLPEAELDRFLFKALVRYPGAGEEEAILRLHDAGKNPRDALESLEPIGDGALDDARREVDGTTVADDVVRYVVAIVESSRRSPDLHLGASPRAGVHLLRSAKANAAAEGRDFVTPDDVKSLAAPVLRHRFVLKPEAEIEGLDADAVVARILSRVEVPR